MNTIINIIGKLLGPLSWYLLGRSQGTVKGQKRTIDTLNKRSTIRGKVRTMKDKDLDDLVG